MMNSDGSGLTKLTDDPADDALPGGDRAVDTRPQAPVFTRVLGR
jgi:hypothetical protein